MVAPNTDTPRLDLCEALLRRMLDPASPEPEAVNSGGKLVIVARRDRIGFDAFSAHMASLVKFDGKPPPRRQKPDECNITMPFGKFCGWSLEEIGRTRPGYLQWAAENLEDEFLGGACAIVHDWLWTKGKTT